MLTSSWRSKENSSGKAGRFQQKNDAAPLKALAFHCFSLGGFHASTSICWILTAGGKSKTNPSSKLTDSGRKIKLLYPEVMSHHRLFDDRFAYLASICWMLTSSRRSRGNSPGLLTDFSSKMILLYRKHWPFIAFSIEALRTRASSLFEVDTSSFGLLD